MKSHPYLVVFPGEDVGLPGVVAREPGSSSTAQTFHIVRPAKGEALKSHRRLLDTRDLLEKEFELAEEQ